MLLPAIRMWPSATRLLRKTATDGQGISEHFWTGRRSRRPLRLAITLAAVMVPFASAAVPAEASCGRSTICNPARSGVWLERYVSGPIVGPITAYMNYGDGLYINCYQQGAGSSGPWGWSTIYDYISWSTQYGWRYQGYIPDNYVYTGTNGPPPGVALCPPGLKGTP